MARSPGFSCPYLGIIGLSSLTRLQPFATSIRFVSSKTRFVLFRAPQRTLNPDPNLQGALFDHGPEHLRKKRSKQSVCHSDQAQHKKRPTSQRAEL